MPLCPQINHQEQKAFYVPSLDYVNMPKLDTFNSAENSYGTLFHELIHSTGHQKRIGRKEVYQNPVFASNIYFLEELIAEIGSCYLKCYTGIPIEN